MPVSVLLVGCGKMGGALLDQWVKCPGYSFSVIDPAGPALPDGVELHTSLSSLGDRQFDMLVVAIKPQLIDTVLPGHASLLSPSGCVLSIAAGCSVARLARAVGPTAIIRVMPNLPSAIGAGVSGLYANSDVTTTHRDQAETLMQAAGVAVWVEDEDQIDRVTAIAGSGPGYVFEFARTYVEAAKALGFSHDQARDLVLGTIAGTVDMARQSRDSLETLRNSVTSPNGTTEAGLAALNGDGKLTALLEATTQAAYKRAVELR